MKAKRKSYHVVWHAKQVRWLVKLNSKIVGLYDRKEDAVEYATSWAKSATLGQIVIHGKDHKIQREYTYPRSSDPKRTKG